MDSPVGNTIKNVAGYGVGTLAALDTIKSGGLGSYLMNRQRLMSDPGFRASLAGSPFAAGIFGVSGDTGPAPAAPGAFPATGAPVQPAEVVGPPPPGVQVAAPGELPATTAYNVPGYMPGTPRQWMPNLPPYDPEEALKQQAFASQQQAVAGGDDVQRGLAKAAVGIMPTRQETAAVLGQAAGIQRQAGAGSTVGVKLPGMTVQIGSPYNIAPLGEEEFSTPEQARQAAAAHGPGWSIGPTVHGGWRPIPPPTGEQLLPPPPGGAPGLPAPPTGPVMRGGGPTTGAPGPARPLPAPGAGTNRIDPYHAAFTNTADVYNLPHGLLNAVAETESSFNPNARGPTLPQGDQAIGLMQFRPATAQQWGVDPTDPMSAIGGAGRYLRALIDQNNGDVAAALQQYGGGPRYPVQHILARADQFRSAIDPASPAPAAPPAQAAPAAPSPPPPPSPPAQRGVAYAAEPPPGAQVFTPPPQAAPVPPPPAPTFDREAVVPHVVVPESQAVGYPSPAPAEEPGPGPPPPLPPPITVRPPTVGTALAPAGAPPPAPVWPGTPHDPVTGMPVQTSTQQYQGGLTQTYRAPELGTFEQQMMARYLGITDPSLIDNPQTVVKYFNWKQGIDDQVKIHAADIERIYAAAGPSQTASLQRLNQIQGTINHILETYSPEQIDYYVGMLKYPAHLLQQKLGVPWADQIAQFRTDIAPIAPSTFEADAKNNTLSGPELGYLAPLALNPRDEASQFKTNLQGLNDGVRRAIAFRDYIQHVPADQVANPAVLEQFNRDFDRQLAEQRLAVTQGARPTPSPAPAAPPPTAPPPPAPQVASPRASAWAPTSTWVVGQ